MKKILLGSASALAFLALSGTAQAQTVSAEIGGALIDLQETFEAGNWTNYSINTAAIDGSVTLDGNGFGGAANIDLGAISLSAEGSAALAAALGISVEDLLLLTPEQLAAALGAAVAAGAQLNLGVDLGQIIADLTVGGTVISRDVIETLAIGAVNTGDIASVTAASSSASNSATSFSFGGLSTESINEASSASNSAANTSNTAASAAASASTRSNESFDLGAITFATSEAENAAASGPLVGVYAANLAYNEAAINASVDVNANLVDLDGIGTTAIGAVNSGTISMGFDGSAFVSEVIGED